MSGAEVALIITSVATLLGVIGTFIIGLRNSRKIEDVRQVAVTRSDAEQMGKAAGLREAAEQRR